MGFKCVFCGTSKKSTNTLGEEYVHNNIQVHYFCLLLSSTITQTGKDTQGILGFTENDIKNELKRSASRICRFCRKGGSSIQCKACKEFVHLPCAIKHGSISYFYGDYSTYCGEHRPIKNHQPTTENLLCIICMEKLDFEEWQNIVHTDCCVKNSFFHKTCLQGMAFSAGRYFLKCPICMNEDTFQESLLTNGIFIPERDAAWEREPDAFSDLYVRQLRCQANCVCPDGNAKNVNRRCRWKIIPCSLCGLNGTHMHCSGLKEETWTCKDCLGANVSNATSSHSKWQQPQLQGKDCDSSREIGKRARSRSASNERARKRSLSRTSSYSLRTKPNGMPDYVASRTRSTLSNPVALVIENVRSITEEDFLTISSDSDDDCQFISEDCKENAHGRAVIPVQLTEKPLRYQTRSRVSTTQTLPLRERNQYSRTSSSYKLRSSEESSVIVVD